MYIIIDTETSGLFDFKKPADDPSQPYLAQLAMIVADKDMNLLAEVDYLVRPDGWEMQPDATAVNGLTTERLLAEGIPIDVVLNAYEALIREDGYAVIAYNAQYDTKVMRGGFRRAGRDDLFALTRNACAMRACMSAKVKNASGRGWPSLEHACNHFGIEVEPRPHNAVFGARKCLEVVRALRGMGVQLEPKVHESKKSEAA